MLKYQGHRRHTAAVAALMPEDVASGRIKMTATQVRMFMTAQEGLAAVEAALDKAFPDWRKDPMLHTHYFPQPRPHYLFLMQLRHNMFIKEEKTDV